jgi:hypothetical protein
MRRALQAANAPSPNAPQPMISIWIPELDTEIEIAIDIGIAPPQERLLRRTRRPGARDLQGIEFDIDFRRR